MTQDQIIALTTPKHIKIYKLSQLGIKKSEIAALLGTNTGHVYNVIKDYAKNESKAAKADLITT